MEKLVRLLTYSVFIFVFWILLNALFIYNYSKHYHESLADVGIVLGAGTNKGKLSPVFEARVNHSIYLFKSHKINTIIFAGGYSKGNIISDSQAAANYAIEKGIPENRILIEEISTFTYSNLIESKKLMDRNGLNSALIISDPIHMKRAMALSNAIEINGLPSPTTMYKSWNSKTKFFIYESFYYNVDFILGHLFKILRLNMLLTF